MSLWLAMRSLCGVLLLAGTMIQAQGQEPAEEPSQSQVEQLPATTDHSPANAPATVHGVVRNAATGEGVPRALVSIEGDASAGTLTDGEGRFEFTGVPLGPQIFEVQKPGFYDPGAIGVRSGKPSENVAHNVFVAVEMPDLDFTLVPAGSIHGQLQLSTGDPAGNFWVSLLRQVVQHGRSEWAMIRSYHTDSEGFYRFGGLPDGIYSVHVASQLESVPATVLIEAGRVGDVPRSGYPATYYPDSRQLASAGRIRLAPGEQAVANIYLVLEPFYTVTATVPDTKGGIQAVESELVSSQKTGSPDLMILDSENHFLYDRATYDPITHTVQAVLPNGNYAFAVSLPESSPPAAGELRSAQGARHPAYLAGLKQFSVAGHAVRDLQIPLSSPRSYPLHLKAQTSGMAQSGTIPPEGMSSAVAVRLGNAGEALVEPDHGWNALKDGPDDIELMRVPLFTYWVHTIVYGKGLCAGALSANGVNLSREPLVLSLSGPSAPIELAVRNDCAQLNLILPAAASVLVPGIEPVYTVYVVPDFDTTENVEPLTLRPSSGGSMTVPKLTPGNYHVYTFTTPMELEYRNPAAMAQLSVAGQGVTLAPGEAGSLLLEVPR